MVNLKKPKSSPSLRIAICLGILALALINCKNPTSTDNDEQPYITVRNSCGIALDIYMDSAFQFYLENDEYYYIENVPTGSHFLEAKRKGTEILVKSQTAEIEANYGYTWTISSNAALKITNNYGETLDIYGDGTYQSDLTDQTDLLIPSIPYGEHLLEAKKQGGTTVVASTTVSIYEDTTYTWTIQK
ncbi:MAG: hypothetical protein WAU81_10805 [Candidatus Aminicenantales bacterium]